MFGWPQCPYIQPGKVHLLDELAEPKSGPEVSMLLIWLHPKNATTQGRIMPVLMPAVEKCIEELCGEKCGRIL